MPEKSDGDHKEHKCWRDSKMMTQSKKAFYVLEFRPTKSTATVQWGFLEKVP